MCCYYFLSVITSCLNASVFIHIQQLMHAHVQRQITTTGTTLTATTATEVEIGFVCGKNNKRSEHKTIRHAGMHSVCLSVCLSAALSVRLSVCCFVCSSVSLSVCGLGVHSYSIMYSMQCVEQTGHACE